jgi:hypothetical protein
MGSDEIMATLQRAFTDAATMSERMSGIAGICNLVQLGVMSNEELTEAFEQALVKVVMTE